MTVPAVVCGRSADHILSFGHSWVLLSLAGSQKLAVPHLLGKKTGWFDWVVYRKKHV